jgi:hypothetical protein
MQRVIGHRDGEISANATILPVAPNGVIPGRGPRPLENEVAPNHHLGATDGRQPYPVYPDA